METNPITCPTCKGRGNMTYANMDTGEYEHTNCPTCHGTGTIPATPDNWRKRHVHIYNLADDGEACQICNKDRADIERTPAAPREQKGERE